MLDEGQWGHVVKNWRNYYSGSAYNNAMNKLHDYVKKNPDMAYAHFLRGYHFGFLGKEEYARKEFAKSIELESRDRLAADLLKMFGDEPSAGARNDSSSNETSAVDGHNHDHATHNHKGLDIAGFRSAAGNATSSKLVADHEAPWIVSLGDAVTHEGVDELAKARLKIRR